MPQSPIPYILSLITFLPLVGAIILMLLPRPKDLPESHGAHGDESHGEPDSPTAPTPADPARRTINAVALIVAGLDFLLSVVLFFSFQSSHVNTAAEGLARNMQFREDVPWMRLGDISIHYRMGVDGISLLLILLTTFLMVLSVLFSFGVKQRLKEFMIFLLLLETGMIGVFFALDLVLFYVFWEAMLIPMYFLIGIFGHENRVYAAIKFFLFTFAGSIFMLVAIIGVYRLTHSFDVLKLSDMFSTEGHTLRGASPQLLMWLYSAFALAFMIKVPMFPFHTWLPDAHVEAPTAGSVILAGVMLKMGTYGFLRFCLPLFPEQAKSSAPLFITLAIVGIIYGSLVAAVQPDAKKLVAYSSVAHLGFVMLGIFTFTPIGMMGALVQNLNHGISTPMLFFLVGMLYDRRHTRQISEFGGLKLIVPGLAAMMLIATLASIAVPFFNGFVGEFPILLGSWSSVMAGSFPTALAATGMILSAVYMLWWFQRLMLGPVTRPANRHLPDLTRNEWLVLTPLAIMIFWIGLASPYWTRRMDESVDTLLPYNMWEWNGDLSITEYLNHQRLRSSTEAEKNNPNSIRKQVEEQMRNVHVVPLRPRAGGPGGRPGAGAPGGGGPPGRPAGAPGGTRALPGAPAGGPPGRPATPPGGGRALPGAPAPGGPPPSAGGSRTVPVAPSQGGPRPIPGNFLPSGTRTIPGTSPPGGPRPIPGAPSSGNGPGRNAPGAGAGSVRPANPANPTAPAPTSPGTAPTGKTGRKRALPGHGLLGSRAALRATEAKS
jgi:NADH-quinone oxidoreductase subunit M